MTDSSMNFGPAWIRNMPSEGTTTGGGTGGGSRYQLAEHRYGREEMLALFDKFVKPPSSLLTFKTLYSEQTLVPLALLPTTEEEQRGWQSRPVSVTGAPRGRGGSLERGGRISRGRGGYQAYGRATSAYDSGWGNGEQPDWSPRKEYPSRSLADNWRKIRNSNEDDDGWRHLNSTKPLHEKWTRSTSWRGDGDSEEKNGPPERGGRSGWHENNRGAPLRRSWDNEDHLPEWAMENPTEGGGTFDERGAFHGSDDEHESRFGGKRDLLQKSTSQQHISGKNTHNSLASSNSATSLTKFDEIDKHKQETSEHERVDETSPEKKREKCEGEDKCEEVKGKAEKTSNNGPPPELVTPNIDKVDEDFERLQEDLVLKLVVDEDTPKSQSQPSANFEIGAPQVQPPPNLVPPVSQDKWYYQDPQGTRQGPFPNVEMADWYKAGYFSNHLNVMRECDERYFLLGELINMCGGENPFLSNIRFPVLKNETKLPEDVLSYQYLSQLAFKQQAMRNLTEPWSALTLQQQELAAQRLILQQQQQIPHDLSFMQQSAHTNSLMYMINQMQQTNKIPGLVDKPPSAVPNQLDPLLVQIGNLHSLQNRLHNPLSNVVSPALPPDALPNLQTPIPSGGGVASIPGIHGNLPAGLASTVNRPPIESLPPNQENEALTNFLKQFEQQRQMNLESPWQKSNPFNVTPPVSTSTAQWPQQPETPLAMWDIPTPNTSLPSEEPNKSISENEKENQSQQPVPQKQPVKEETFQKELKKRKEQEEKQAKKEAEERRKQEQKKQEVEKRQVEEKKRKEEERIRKELEKAKKEAEEKRLRELEEKRRLKEQRKADEEAKKKQEESKKVDDEKIRREAKEKEEKKQIEARLAQNNRAASKSAPWCQSNFTSGVNLTEIQKAEKERKAQEVALQLQKQQQMQEQQQQQVEKASGLQLNWAKKPMEPRKVKSFAEIQAEEQERCAKLTAEARVAAQLKEKEVPIVVTSGNIWNGQTLTWANASSASQCSNNTAGGFWDEVPAKSSNKPSTVSKSNSTSAMTATKQPPQQKQSKSKPKKEESTKAVNNNNNNQSKDEFTDWCYKTLSNISADVDIPTFITFLRDIESAYDVRDYCKEYLGESSATQQFASNFLEKRRSFKPKNNAHKDDMCSPAPAITPSTQHSTEFQEVKGKNKKNKKSKMLKVDSRILGFNVTSAPDRINVGDRDYGDNS